MANEISYKTGCSNNEIIRILNSLGDVVKDKFSDKDNYVEVKLFPGLKVTSRYIPPEQSKSNLYENIGNLDYVLNLSSTFTDDFRKKIRELHKKIQ